MLSIRGPTTFCFLSPPFPHPKQILHIKGAGLVSKMVVVGKEWDRESVGDERTSQSELKTRQGERILSFSFFWPWRGLYAAPTLPPSPFLFLCLLVSQPHLFTLTGLERALASPAVSSPSFLFCSCLCRSPHFLPWKRLKRRSDPEMKYSALDISALSFFRADSLLPQSFDFINKWSTVASSTARPPVYMWLSCMVPQAKPCQ